jgi:hypothetical protein
MPSSGESQVKKTLVIGPEYTHEQYPVAPCHHISEEERKKVNFENGAKRKGTLLFYSLLDALTDNLQMTPNPSMRAGRNKGRKRIRKTENKNGRKDDKNQRRKEERRNKKSKKSKK